MAKLEEQTKRKKESKHGSRFYTSLDMAIVKHDEAVRNSRAKRGEIEKKGNEYISVCGCGAEGCFIHSGGENVSEEQLEHWNKWKDDNFYHKNRSKKGSKKEK